MMEIDFQRISRLLLSHHWIFAKTMPGNPHWYTLRKHWKDADFCYVVSAIREHGYSEIFKGRRYIMFDINGMKYWTMGAQLEQTILINRAKILQDAFPGLEIKKL